MKYQNLLVVVFVLALIPDCIKAQGDSFGRNTPPSGGDVFTVVSVTPMGQDRFDVKLRNKRTGYTHSATVYIDVASRLIIGGTVQERRSGRDVVIIPIGPRHPSPPERERTPMDLPGRLPCKGPNGHPIDYRIVGLGTQQARAWARRDDGRDDNLDAIIRSRQVGVDRPFRWEESLFDQFTGRQGNWVGSDWSGGQIIRPGGIGNVEQPCLNGFDCAAKTHDIQSWLEANFNKGCIVNIWMNGRWEQFIVKDFAGLTSQVADEFRRTARATLENALAIAERDSPRDPTFVGHIQKLQRDLWNPVTLPGNIGEILNDPKIMRGVPRDVPH